MTWPADLAELAEKAIDGDFYTRVSANGELQFRCTPERVRALCELAETLRGAWGWLRAVDVEAAARGGYDLEQALAAVEALEKEEA